MKTTMPTIVLICGNGPKIGSCGMAGLTAPLELA